MKSTHSQRLERWLGSGRIERISQSMRGWYGPPIHLLDCPGSVRVGGDGDFIGPFERGYFMSAADSLWEAYKRAARVPPGTLYAGFASISDALLRASSGYGQLPAGNIYKAGPTGVIGVTSSLHKVGTQPPAGVAAPAAPGGGSPVDSDTGGMWFTNPASGTLHLTGADFTADTANMTLLLYDRIFAVAKTMNSSTTEAVTGVPDRYQSTTSTDPNYVGGNFLFVEVGLTALAATAHNWTVCTYKNQANADSTLPSLTGNASAIIHRLDHPTMQFFAPLASGDVGIKALTQMQCSAAVATGLIDFVIGHPIGFMSFPIAKLIYPFDWLTNRNQAPRIFNDAYLAFLDVCKPATTPTYFTGQIYVCSAAA